jgi:uncharacterized membrane protein YebE (DUF533 family)
MFDAKSLLEALVRGGSPAPQQQPQGGGMGGLGDLLGQMMGGGKPGGAPGGGQGGGLGGLGEILGKLGGAGQGGGAPAGGQGGGMGGGLEEMLRKMMPGGAPGGQGAPQSGGGGLGGGLGDLLGKLGGGGQSAGQPGAPQGGGGLADILGQILGQATSGVKEVGQKVEQHTGIGNRTREAVGQATGQSPDDMMAKLKELIAQHQLGAAATAGGLGAVVLGTKTGRSAAMGAAKLGALALIGGLAYKAYQNYSQGKPVISGASGFTAEQAPSGSGFEPQAVTNDTAILYIRAMISAAASDGRIDAGEQQKIMGALGHAGGADQAARDFLMHEINNPATADQLAAACQSGEQAVQVFTAARFAIDFDSQEENDFLIDLATKLGLDEKLIQHVDAAARAQAA